MYGNVGPFLNVRGCPLGGCPGFDPELPVLYNANEKHLLDPSLLYILRFTSPSVLPNRI